MARVGAAMAAEVKDGGVDAEIGESRGVDGGVGGDKGALRNETNSHEGILDAKRVGAGIARWMQWQRRMRSRSRLQVAAEGRPGQARAAWDVDAIFGRFATA